MKALIVKISSMGDILHTLPSLTDAIQANPKIRFDWVVEECFAQIPAWHEAVDRVIPIAIRRWRKSWFSKSIKAERITFIKAIRAQNYDVIIDAQGLMKSAFLVTRLARGIKHGMNWRAAREPLSSLFYDRCYYIAKQQHAVERTRQLFAKSLGYSKPEIQGDYAILQRFSPQRSLQNKNSYLIFFHATTRDNKHWPEKHWRKLISLLSAKGFRIKLPWGTINEEAQAKRLAAGFNYVEVLPRTELEGIVQQILGATAVVSVDTGFSHLTAALGIPSITLYGPTIPDLIGSYGKKQCICRPKYSSKLSNLNATEVFEKLELLLTEEKRF